ncbi:pyridoxal 5'-phosphate synthase glutaminase subunit PdxT [Streptomyces antimycoticus]|uniref:Pyridoxal 5'-phosphate synthase subunit PdxT n=2 Tax=Streptomyces violaceusniger group TaxID=2839105 RepID=A0ABD5JJ66_9ACTN|nr:MULTISPECIES: pyridoxal 5'-phosphate synthase glutaminase subunit PdxT [Streptomyces]MEE4587607.1 pyridoxal 5'-phosphate synthase glutaminase subunit PdxT [Streptomyces sp. DSM 41602]KUL48494.1 glutamine amidotransferase [Streptomyces violaceusniger]RSS38200.1 pyridoxal 5'-phosphate synthase glutaminase subunit PdxT [Streptomyces sp. WAC05858]WJD96080.1 pyridoxal 5'-phosphate synthase glutaminase subunit PdxT [Streptomyces antimycoticus]WTB04397.1 pyridoxal 5'-phosphate synthase glutaminase
MTTSSTSSTSTPGAPVIGVLALQGDVREHFAALTAAGATPRQVRRPEELAEVEALVIPGGESTTMSKLAVIFGLLEPLRERVRAGMPVYGTCAGMIMLADKILDGRDDQETIGGIDMIVRRNAFGRQNESFEARVDIEGIDGGPVEGVFIRAPWVESVGGGAEVLATFDGHTVAVRQGNVLATSFHPELTGDHRVHKLFVEMVRPA